MRGNLSEGMANPFLHVKFWQMLGKCLQSSWNFDVFSPNFGAKRRRKIWTPWFFPQKNHAFFTKYKALLPKYIPPSWGPWNYNPNIKPGKLYIWGVYVTFGGVYILREKCNLTRNTAVIFCFRGGFRAKVPPVRGWNHITVIDAKMQSNMNWKCATMECTSPREQA